MNFASFTPAFFHKLSDAAGNPIYANTAAVDFFDRLTAGTYGDPSYSSWYPTDTCGWIARLGAARSDALINTGAARIFDCGRGTARRTRKSHAPSAGRPVFDRS